MSRANGSSAAGSDRDMATYLVAAAAIASAVHVAVAGVCAAKLWTVFFFICRRFHRRIKKKKTTTILVTEKFFFFLIRVYVTRVVAKNPRASVYGVKSTRVNDYRVGYHVDDDTVGERAPGGIECERV